MLQTREAGPRVPRWLRGAAFVLGLAVIVAALVLVVQALLNAPATDIKKAQRITLITTPPPPPKPPEKPPEPPKPREEVKINEPQPQDSPKPAESNEPPPGPLGLDAQGTGPGDGFGLAARPGGRDITIAGQGGGGLGAIGFAHGAARHIAAELARHPQLRGTNYRIEMRIWVTREGRLERFEIIKGSGSLETDDALREALTQIAPLRLAVPENLPQPMRIRVTSGDA